MNKLFTLSHRVGCANKTGFLGVLLVLLPLLGWGQTTLVNWNFTDSDTKIDIASSGNADRVISAVVTASPPTYSYPGTPNLAISTTGWDVGSGSKYWQIDFASAGYTNLQLASKQFSSNTGPRDFKVQYKVGTGGAWTDVPGATTTLNSTSLTSLTTALPAAADDATVVYVRWIMTSNLQVGTGNVSSGTSRIDDIVVTGTAIASGSSAVTTSAASNSSATSATLGGNIMVLGSPVPSANGVVYSSVNAAPTVGQANSTVVAASIPATTTGAFTVSVTSLIANTLYNYRAYVTNNTGTSYGGVQQLTTKPAVSTAAVTTFDQTTATAGGTVAAGGGEAITDRGVYYSQTNGFANGTGTQVPAGPPTSAGSFGTSLSGLTSGTTYYVVAYATNAGGTSYGGQQSFTTMASGAAPTITVSALSPATMPSLGTVALNTPGGIYTYAVSGANLTTGVTITPPAGVEVSKDGFSASGNSNATPLTLPASGGSVASTTISVRLAASASAGTVGGAISNVAGTASQSVVVSGTIAAAPAGCLSEGFESAAFPSAGWQAAGVARSTAAGDFKNGVAGAVFNGITGSLTTPALVNPLLLTFYLGVTGNASAKQFQVNISTTSPTSGFSPIRIFSHNTTGGTVLADNSYNQYTVDLSAYNGSSTVYVQFAKVNSATSSPFRFDDVAVSCGAAPALALSTGSVGGPQFCIAKTTPTSIVVPYTVSGGSFGTGNVFTAVISKDNFVTKNIIGTLGAVSSGSIAGTLPNTLITGTYRVRVEASAPTLVSPDNGTDLELTSYLTNDIDNSTYFGTGDNGQVTLTWTNPTGCFGQLLIVAKAGSIPSTALSNATTYAANPAFGLGSELPAGSRQYVVYQGSGTSVTITGLTNGTAYYFKAFVTNGDGYSNGSVRTVTPVVPATLTEVYVPQVISGHAAGALHTERLPYAYRVTIGGLKPSTTYKYYNSAVSANAGTADAAGYQGTGNPIYPDGAGSFRRVVGNNLSSAGSTLTTNAGGSYTGWFMLEPNGNDRFEAGDLVRMRIILNDGAGGSSEVYYVTTTSTVSVRQLGTTSGAATQATALYGSSFGTSSNFVLTYDNTAGLGRPLAATFLESDGSANTSGSSPGNSYASFYGANVEGKAGAYGLLIPNDNANGVQRLEQRSLADGSLVGCAATDADGTWPGTGAATKSPAGGATPLVLTSGDTPFYPATITGFLPTAALEETTITITGTSFTTGPRPLVSFNGGPATAAATVNDAGTSLTVIVPAGATSGPVSVTAGCGTVAISTGRFTVTKVPPGLLVLEDDFNYPAGSLLTDNGWAQAGGSMAGPAHSVVAGNLTKPKYPVGYQSINANQAHSSSGTSSSISKGFTLPGGQNPVYLATLLTIPVNGAATAGSTGQDYFLHLLERTNAAGTTTKNAVARLSARPGTTAGTYNLGLATAANPVQYAAQEFREGQTCLIVLKYTCRPGGTDETQLFAFDNATVLPIIEPGTALIGPLQEANNVSFNPPNGVAIRQDAATPTVNLDGIRVATGWGAALGSPFYTNVAAIINAGSYYDLTLDNADMLTTAGAVRVENSLNLTNGILTTTAAGLLTLQQGASSTGGSASSFVNGPLARTTVAGAQSVFFPIGKGAAYRPLTLTAGTQANATTYTAEQFNASARTSALADPLKRISSVRYFTVTPAPVPGAGQFSGTVTLSYGSDDQVNFPAEASLVVAKRSGSAASWLSIDRSGYMGAAGSTNGPVLNGTLTSAAFTNFSDFALASTLVNAFGSPANPLPVELAAFTAERKATGVQLRWSTASERNSAFFEVQRSLDGHTFTPVSKVAGHGSSTSPVSYTSFDRAAPAGRLYYRLRQADADSSSTFSPVRSVSSGMLALSIFPNPAQTIISFQNPTGAPLPYRVLNQLGQVLCEGVAPVGIATIYVAGLPAGSYLLELQTGLGRSGSRFTKE